MQKEYEDLDIQTVLKDELESADGILKSFDIGDVYNLSFRVWIDIDNDEEEITKRLFCDFELKYNEVEITEKSKNERLILIKRKLYKITQVFNRGKNEWRYISSSGKGGVKTIKEFFQDMKNNYNEEFNY